DSARRQADLHDAPPPDRNPRCRRHRRRSESRLRSALRGFGSALNSSTTKDTKVHGGESLGFPSCPLWLAHLGHQRRRESRFPCRIRPALTPKQVRSLHEEVPSVIEQPSAFSVPQLSVNVRPQRQ